MSSYDKVKSFCDGLGDRAVFIEGKLFDGTVNSGTCVVGKEPRGETPVSVTGRKDGDRVDIDQEGSPFDFIFDLDRLTSTPSKTEHFALGVSDERLAHLGNEVYIVPSLQFSSERGISSAEARIEKNTTVNNKKYGTSSSPIFTIYG